MWSLSSKLYRWLSDLVVGIHSGRKLCVCSSRPALDLSPAPSMNYEAEQGGFCPSVTSSWGQPWGSQNAGWAAFFLPGHCGLTVSLD